MNDNTSETNEDYKFKTNVNNTLAKILEIPEMKHDELSTWEPPKENGLRNSISIIPGYYNHYQTDYQTDYFNLDYFEIIKDDIRNMRTLNKYQIDYIKNLSSDQKNELIEIFNQCLYTINDLLMK
jgi:hypothetical protein